MKRTHKAIAAVGATVALAMSGVGVAASASAAMPAWLHVGSTTQYPTQGGTWTYGFWNIKVRSYYTVNRCHGSTVDYNGNRFRSIDTAANAPSVAELYAINTSGATDTYYFRTC